MDGHCLIFLFPYQHAWPILQFSLKSAELIFFQNQCADFSFYVSFTFSAQIIKVIRINISHQHQVNNAGMFVLRCIIINRSKLLPNTHFDRFQYVLIFPRSLISLYAL
jgi:hypothetical protein